MTPHQIAAEIDARLHDSASEARTAIIAEILERHTAEADAEISSLAKQLLVFVMMLVEECDADTDGTTMSVDKESNGVKTELAKMSLAQVLADAKRLLP